MTAYNVPSVPVLAGACERVAVSLRAGAVRALEALSHSSLSLPDVLTMLVTRALLNDPQQYAGTHDRLVDLVLSGALPTLGPSFTVHVLQDNTATLTVRPPDGLTWLESFDARHPQRSGPPNAARRQAVRGAGEGLV